MTDKEVDITDAKCEMCKNKVEPQLHYNTSFRPNKKGEYRTYITDGLCFLWSCNNHGAVGAYIGKKYYADPRELFKKGD